MSDHRPETIARHGGRSADPAANARAVPIDLEDIDQALANARQPVGV
jgi:hypothetical protein